MWTPKEVRKLLLLVSGLIFVGAGILLMINQVTANGALDIELEFVKGKIQSGSAGLFVCFIGLIICLSSATFKFNLHEKFQDKRLALISLLLSVVVICIYFMVANPKLTYLGFIIAPCLFFVLILIFIMADTPDN